MNHHANGPYEQSEEIDEGDEDAIDVSEIKGVDRARDRLLPWFRKILDSIEEEQSPLHVVLAQVTSQGPQEVTKIPHDLASPPDDTMNQLLAIAAEDMCEASFSGSKISYSILVRLQSGTTERQTFVLEIPRPQNTTMPSSRYSLYRAVLQPFRHDDRLDEETVLVVAEGPLEAVRILLKERSKSEIVSFALQDEQLQALMLAPSLLAPPTFRSVEKNILLRTIDRLKEENQYLKHTQFARDRELQILLDGNLQRQIFIDEHRTKVARDADASAPSSSIPSPSPSPSPSPRGTSPPRGTPRPTRRKRTRS